MININISNSPYKKGWTFHLLTSMRSTSRSSRYPPKSVRYSAATAASVRAPSLIFCVKNRGRDLSLGPQRSIHQGLTKSDLSQPSLLLIRRAFIDTCFPFVIDSPPQHLLIKKMEKKIDVADSSAVISVLWGRVEYRLGQ